MKPLSAVVVDDEKYACERLAKLLGSMTEINVMGCFNSSVSATGFILKKRPDLVFLDVELENNVSAFDVIGKLHESGCRPCIILVTGHQHYSIKAIRSGVFDYLVKPVDIDELKQAIDRFVKHINSVPDILPDYLNLLTCREKEVLKLALAGKTSKEIAEELKIGINTVSTHRRNILKKTGRGSFVEIIRKNHP